MFRRLIIRTPLRRYAAPTLLIAAACFACRPPAPRQLTGQQLYEERCGNCHALPRPTAYPSSAWPGLVADMTPEAGLTADEAEAILRYLVPGKDR
jgi:hypothetical protein